MCGCEGKNDKLGQEVIIKKVISSEKEKKNKQKHDKKAANKFSLKEKIERHNGLLQLN